jgi:nitroimidazol reductase NimA-like FMN-containing flavoprotein (pyridoxamine 5'-phosphate oxidase superfamily)
LKGRGHYDRATVHAILDEGLVGHAAFVADGQPYSIPMLYARDGEQLFLHGSRLSRLLRGLAEGVPMCFTVTLVDGLVLARSAFHHSVNYRSVMVLGEARSVGDAAKKNEALRTIVDHVARGRSDDVRGPSTKELRATEVITLPLAEVSAKVRTGPPVDAAEDYALPTWAGELPLTLVPGVPVADERCASPVPSYVTDYRRVARA